ncbi:universal stress protein [Oceaniglobus roseus]|uniref:universal stress protein n=1 Tax=Oceaniglobus roseus TaxID=1737570 RepID=UPI000C7F6964|nr:universal stress protein [Kandeliimicrobium roseum]
MPGTKIVVGLDGSEASSRVLDVVRQQAKAMESCEVIAVYVIEWSPFSFQTPEENAERHKRREQDIKLARERVVEPALAALQAGGLSVSGRVEHGDAADILDRIAVKEGAAQIIIGRVGARGLTERIFGGVSGRLVAQSSVPVTIVP